MERRRRQEIKSVTEKLIIPLSAIGLFAVSFFAFSKKSKREIGTRDKWTCQGCGKKFGDGHMVHGAHNPDKHHKGPDYDKPSSGSIRCVDCHQEQHEEGTTLGLLGDTRAVRLLEATDRKTRKWRERNK